jgi:hypothetical protein
MQLVANLGFPAIVTMYLLVRIEGKLESLSIGINSLNSNISELNNKMVKKLHIPILIRCVAYLFQKSRI